MSKATLAAATSVAVTASLSLALLAAVSPAACTTHQCQASSSTLPDAGFWSFDCSIGCGLTWRSGSFIGQWIDFPASKTYTFELPPIPQLPPGDRANFTELTPIAYVAIAPPETLDGSAPTNVTEIAGVNLQYTGFTPNSLTITNPTCADYFVNIILGVEVDEDGSVGTAEQDGGTGADEPDGGTAADEPDGSAGEP